MPFMLTPPDDFLPPLSRRTSNAEDNVLPLINVVFLLLIFFMVSGTLMQEPPFELSPPSTQHAETQESQADYLAIGADGRLAWAGESIDKDELSERLVQRPNPDSPLHVRADRKLTARDLNDLLATLRSGGVAQIQLLTESR